MTNTAEAVKEEEAKMLARSVAEDQLCEEAPRVFTWLLSSISILLVIITAPLSLLFVLKVVQENILKNSFSFSTNMGTQQKTVFQSFTKIFNQIACREKDCFSFSDKILPNSKENISGI